LEDDDVLNDPFHPNNVGKVQLIVLMRLYDVEMAKLANMNEAGEAAADFLHEQHQLGRIVGALPWLDLTNED